MSKAAPAIAVSSAGVVFPHCPKCGSYYLYRKDNVSSFECETCGLLDISEEVARRLSAAS